MGFTRGQLEQIRLVLRTICPFSIAANFAVVAIVAFVKRKQTTLGYLHAFLSLSDIWLAISWITGDTIAESKDLCIVFGALYEYFVSASSCWSFLIALHCYIIVIYSPKAAGKYWMVYLTYGIGVPSILVVGTFVSQFAMKRGDVFGDAEYQCWISPNYPELRIAFYYSVLWLHFVLILCFYIRIYFMIQSRARDLSTTQETLNTIDDNMNGPTSPKEEESHKIVYSSLSRSKSLACSKNLIVIDRSFTSRFEIPTNSKVSLSPIDQPDSLYIQPPNATSTIQQSQKSSCLSYSHSQSTFNQSKSAANILNDSPRSTMIQRAPTPTQPSYVAKMSNSRNKLVLKTAAIAVGTLISWLPATILQILVLNGNAEPPHSLSILTAVGFGLSGFWNSGSFLMDFVVEHLNLQKQSAAGIGQTQSHILS
ncbi:hypothetical protein BCR33DRAFT_766528 [Rhizoclosmatium globosum]|uniref:G-protein coupled receptors family 2 profile 2 domain-containing protein n=1 Tax=Rhizoclosmatium globosum TaxID=329046 RepID=A0A1Y2C8C5_9FUNG|nr:hypothetical protein BCR33DRAFT_766528 [Rhizoclosmatium globosum]|eukprot:ORY43283.1 hypothetical protein BCR33DRAFT_766528 [Rhizoclosmatium globosum]